MSLIERLKNSGSGGMSETRNSALREAVNGPVGEITKVVHKRFPSLTADEVSAASVIGVLVGALLSVRENRRADNDNTNVKARILVGSLIASGQLLDAFDGALARLIDSENPGSIDFNRGQRVDVLSDRLQEAILAIARIVIARDKHKKVGETAATTALVTNGLPSLTRAHAEFRGIAVPETGKGVIGFFGTRAGRGITGTLGTAFHETQPIFDALTTISNVVTSVQRVRTEAMPGKHLPKKTVEQGKVRAKDLFILQGVVMAASLVIHLYNRKVST